MKAARIAFAVAVLFALALPSSADICGYCDFETNKCVQQFGLQQACDQQTCWEYVSMGCERAPKPPDWFTADYSVASVEIQIQK